MCRFVAYMGEQGIKVEQLLREPANSLIKQSRWAKEGLHGVNADGFGMAWYDLDDNEDPGIFKTIQPAWNDSNLAHLCKKISSKCFLAHIRASTVGDVTKSNCHPFSHGQYSFVHNGTIRKFDKLKLKLFNFIDEDLFLKIRGNTDSECFFFLVMHFLEHQGCKDLIDAVRKSFEWINNLQTDEDQENFSRLNIAISNGRELIATRCVIQNDKALSLYYAKQPKGFTIASEPLDDIADRWVEVPTNHYLHIIEGSELAVKPI